MVDKSGEYLMHSRDSSTATDLFDPVMVHVNRAEMLLRSKIITDNVRNSPITLLFIYIIAFYIYYVAFDQVRRSRHLV
jgi:hypothetical protein